MVVRMASDQQLVERLVTEDNARSRFHHARPGIRGWYIHARPGDAPPLPLGQRSRLLHEICESYFIVQAWNGLSLK